MEERTQAGNSPRPLFCLLYRLARANRVLLIKRPVVQGIYLDVDMRIKRANALREVNIYNTVVIRAKIAANRILHDLQNVIQVALQGCLKIALDIERDIAVAHALAESGLERPLLLKANE